MNPPGTPPIQARLDLTGGEMNRVSTHQSLLKAAISEQHRPSAPAEPCAFQPTLVWPSCVFGYSQNGIN